MKRYATARNQSILWAMFALMLLSACGQSATPVAAPTTTETQLNPVIAVSELIVGSNRLALGVIKNGTPVNDPNLTVSLRFFDLKKSEQPIGEPLVAAYRGKGLPFGLYVAYPTFSSPGSWGMEVTMRESGGVPQIRRLALEIAPTSSTPAVGDSAFPSMNDTLRTIPDITRLTSDSSPDPDLYQRTIAEVIAAKRPFLVAFSTPLYCKTAVCGPNLDVIKQLKPTFQNQIDFIHVEVYPYPFGESAKAATFVPAMAEWKLLSEPWAFLVDANGVIQAKYEGGLTFAELEPALKQLAAGQPIVPLSDS